MDLRAAASEEWGDGSLLARIGFSTFVFQKLEVIGNFERKKSPNSFPCATRSPYLDTCPHHSFYGTSVLDRKHKSGNSHCSWWLLYTVRFGWHLSVPRQGFVQMSIETSAGEFYIKWIMFDRVSICWLPTVILWGIFFTSNTNLVIKSRPLMILHFFPYFNILNSAVQRIEYAQLLG